MIKLSVIIPTRNRSLLTGALLDSLAQLDPVPWEWEVLVVDNGSTDNTAEMVKEKQNTLPIRIRYVLEERPGLHQGRNRGAIEAKGKYLAYLDDDMLLAPSWLQGVAMLDEGKTDAVVGRIIPKWEASPPEWLNRMCEFGFFGPLALLDLGKEPVATEHFYGCNLFIPRKTVLDFGGFHPDGMPQDLLQYRGDGETGLWMKMRVAGKSLWYSPLAIAHHIVPKSRMTAEYMKKRAYNQGISNSFSDLRMRHGLYGKSPTGLRSLEREAKNRLRRLHILMFARYRLDCFSSRSEVEREIIHVQYEMAKGYAQGWVFHRAEFCNNTKIRTHVLKTSFLSCGQKEGESNAV
jgi:glycosyltransferase involved in cell wall biosynthesis